MPLRWNCCKGNESPTDLDRGRIIMHDANLPVIWVFGGRCSGKTTLCERIVDKYQLQHIDCDNILRFEALRQSARGVDIMARLNRHERLPHDILIKLLREIMPRHVKVTKGYILDNFPATVEQGDLFEEKICKVTSILYVKASAKTMMKRYKRRESDTRETKTSSFMGTNELFFRPVAVHDVVLVPEKIDAQINDFATLSPTVLEHYSKILRVVDAEKTEDEMFRQADGFIQELRKTYDIPDRGNINNILMKNFLVEKSAVPRDESFVDTQIDPHMEKLSTLQSTIGPSRLKITKPIEEDKEGSTLQVAGFAPNDDDKGDSFRDSLRRSHEPSGSGLEDAERDSSLLQTETPKAHGVSDDKKKKRKKRSRRASAQSKVSNQSKTSADTHVAVDARPSAMPASDSGAKTLTLDQTSGRKTDQKQDQRGTGQPKPVSNVKRTTTIDKSAPRTTHSQQSTSVERESGTRAASR